MTDWKTHVSDGGAWLGTGLIVVDNPIVVYPPPDKGLIVTSTVVTVMDTVLTVTGAG